VVLDTGAGVCVVDLQRPEVLEGAIPLADVPTDDAPGTGQTLTPMRAAGVWRWPGAARGTTILAVPAPLADLAAKAGTAVAAVIGAEALLRAGGCLTWRHAEDGDEGTGR